MKLHVIVAPRHDLDFIIEEEFTEIKSNISVYDLVSELAQTQFNRKIYNCNR